LIVVADASPLIGLAQIGYLELLASLYGEVQIPSAVHKEIVDSPEFPGNLPRWLQVRAAGDVQLVATLQADLDPGEAEAVALAIELQGLLLVDELDARRVARARGVSVVGTLGVLIRAKQSGLISRVEPLLSALDAVDFWMSESVRAAVLHEAGEL
jgi:predicted nucleic acid-binding protein